jgi:Icc-related predicted phosphoesterase
MAIYCCGDTHGRHDLNKLRHFRNTHDTELTKDDYLIICGDFGLLWNNPYFIEYYGEESFAINNCLEDTWWSAQELDLLNWYNTAPWTTLFVDGNHENYERLAKYPVSEWHGGRVQKICNSVIHLMRGEIYEIDGYSFFCMGGAMSTDRGTYVGDEAESEGKWWWPQEIPSEEEWENAYKNLGVYGNKVDFIVTHDAPAGINVRKGYRISRVSNELEMIRQTVDFKHWFCGHLHEDERHGKVDILYNQLPVNVENYIGEYE